MHVYFSQSWREPVKSVADARDCSTAREKCAFLAGSSVSCLGELCNFLVEQLTSAQIYTSSKLSILSGKIWANPTGSVGRQDCAILEPSSLPKTIAQFLEGRLVAL